MTHIQKVPCNFTVVYYSNGTALGTSDTWSSVDYTNLAYTDPSSVDWSFIPINYPSFTALNTSIALGLRVATRETSTYQVYQDHLYNITLMNEPATSSVVNLTCKIGMNVNLTIK